MSNINGDAGIDHMAAALTDAAGDLELISNETTQMQGEFESHGWSGLDILSSAQTQINGVREKLVVVAEKIGVGGGVVRDAHLNNQMIGHASKESLGQA